MDTDVKDRAFADLCAGLDAVQLRYGPKRVGKPDLRIVANNEEQLKLPPPLHFPKTPFEKHLEETKNQKTIEGDFADRVAALNDAFRTAFPAPPPVPGDYAPSPGVQELDDEAEAAILKHIAAHNEFTPESDPEGYRDFGAFMFEGRQMCWNIEVVQDSASNELSPHPDDPERSFRVLYYTFADEPVEENT